MYNDPILEALDQVTKTCVGILKEILNPRLADYANGQEPGAHLKSLLEKLFSLSIPLDPRDNGGQPTEAVHDSIENLLTYTEALPTSGEIPSRAQNFMHRTVTELMIASLTTLRYIKRGNPPRTKNLLGLK